MCLIAVTACRDDLSKIRFLDRIGVVPSCYGGNLPGNGITMMVYVCEGICTAFRGFACCHGPAGVTIRLCAFADVIATRVCGALLYSVVVLKLT